MIILLIKASVVSAIMLLFYKLFLEKESFFRANRVYLLSCLILSCLLPFIVFPKYIEHQGFIDTLLESNSLETLQVQKDRTTNIQTSVDQQVASTKNPPAQVTQHKSKPNTTEASPIALTESLNSEPSTRASHPQDTHSKSLAFWIFIMYIFGVAVLFLNLSSQIVSTIWKIIKSKDVIEDTNAIIINMETAVEPCSFFKYIFINPTIYDYPTYEQILCHEKIHVDQLHTIDLLISELAIIVFWFNPFIWALRKEVEKNIEYQTDDILLQEQKGTKAVYQLNLVKIASNTMPLSITTNYNQSLIKQRIFKMNSKKSNTYTYWKYAFVAPLLFTIVLIINKPLESTAQTDNSQAILHSDSNKAHNPMSEEHISEPPKTTITQVVTTYAGGIQPTQATDVPLNQSKTTTKVTFQNNGSNSSDCKRLLAAVRIQDIPSIKELLKSIDASCIDPEPEFDKIIHNNQTFWKRKSASPLFAAARDGNIEIGQMLINAGSEVSLQLDGEGTPLITAAQYGQLEFVKLLIENGSELNRYLPNEGNALIAAASNGHTEVAKYLLSIGADLKFDAPNQGTALIAASSNGHIKTVEFLLSEGARIDYTSPNQGNALIAAATNGFKSTSEFLLTNGASIDYDTPNQGNALIAAANNGHIETVKSLIDQGASINYYSPNQGNPLIAAANNGHIQTIQYLISEGADINFESPNQGTPLIAAANNGHLQTVGLLLEQGAKLDFESPNQGTALIAAANNGHTEVLLFLISKGSKINHISSNQGSALIAAANNGHKESIRILLEKGAEINMISSNQGTALIAAANNGHTGTVALLIEKGADKGIHVHGHNALEAALNNGHHNTAEYLRRKGLE